MRLPGALDGFELAVRAILGQQVTVAAASNLAGRLVRICGIPLPQPKGPITHLFPTASELANADLSMLGIPSPRRRSIQALAKAVEAGEVTLTGAADRPATIATLLDLPGIGPWTTAYIAMRALRDPDAFPETDLGIRRALEMRGLAVSARKAAEAWRPWRAYAAIYLWDSLSRPPAAATKPGEST